MTPLIGLTTNRMTGRHGYPQIYLAEAYVSALSRAGANPVLIPLGLPEAVLQGIACRLDGIVFTGGGDVEPQRYGSQPHPLVGDVDPDRDRVEIQLLEQTIRDGLPFLGICRGIQLINIGLGGTIYEDILDQRPGALRHQYLSEVPRHHPVHSVDVEPGSSLAEILQRTSTPVNSFHHQGINRLAPGLQATAYAPDGLIEAVELPNFSFGLAVQWHPEWMQDDEAMQRLFKAFVEAAGSKK